MDEKVVKQRNLERARLLIQTLLKYLTKEDFEEIKKWVELEQPINYGNIAKFDYTLRIEQGYVEVEGQGVCKRIVVQATHSQIALYSSGIHAFCAAAITLTNDLQLLESSTMVTPHGVQINPSAIIKFENVWEDYLPVNFLDPRYLTVDQGYPDRDASLEFVVLALQTTGLMELE